MNFRGKNVFPILILLITFVSVNQWSTIPLGNTFVEWIISFSIILNILLYKKKYFHPKNGKDYLIVTFYFVWMLFGVIRGIFIADGYWEWRQWVIGSLSLSLPIFVYIFSSPKVLRNILSVWIKYGLPLFFIFFIWVLPPDAYQVYTGPVLLLSCFLPILKNKWQIIFVILLGLMIFADFGARSQVIKALAALMMSGAYLMSKYLSDRILRILHWLFYLLPLILLIMGISGTFNVFKGLMSNEGKYKEHKIVDGQVVEDDLSADTRTFIYEEVIMSAFKNNYVLWGRTPARGNDSQVFGYENAQDLKTGKYERHSNEVCFTNVFTWLGLIGMVLYCFIYLKSSYLAVYKSNNIFIKLIGVFIAFRFFYGWIEDGNTFNLISITIWMMIGMAFSESFRKMNDMEFKRWIRYIFRA